MRIKTICILIRILKDYLELLSATKIKVNPEWRNFFTKWELLAMAPTDKHGMIAFPGGFPSYNDIFSKIGTEALIIGHILVKLGKCIQNDSIPFDNLQLETILIQLDDRDNYLRRKKPANYTEEDKETLKVLLKRAGWVHKALTYVDAKQQPSELADIIKNLPPIFYDTQSEIHEILSFLMDDGYITKDMDIKILETEFVFNPKSPEL